MIAAVVILSIMMWLGTRAWATPPSRRSGPAQHADLVIISGKVWTGLTPTGVEQVQEPTAIAVRGSDIVAIGTNATVRSQVGPRTRVIDANGRRVIPGMTDSHAHLIGGGLQLARLHLRDVRSREEFTGAVAAEARMRHPGQWVLGGRWSVESWEKPEPPDKSWLDPVTGDIPVFLTRMDGHQALVNSAALKLAGIDANGPADPAGGEIERDPRTREPTGILKEDPAMELVRDLIPKPSADELYEALRRSMKHANALGITSVHSMCDEDHLAVFRRAHADGALAVRITAYLEADDWSAAVGDVATSDLRHDMIHLAGLKGYMDGSLGSRTAYMREPYSDATPEEKYSRGQLAEFALDPGRFQNALRAANDNGVQMAVHAIGDEANHLLLDAYELARKERSRSGPRPRIEHAQHLLVSDIPRFAELGVVASMQPFHKADDGRYAEKAIGEDRLAGSYAFRQLVDSGALVCFGSDWPVVSMNPFAGIDSAVSAKTLAGNVWLPSHSLTLEEALRAYIVSPPRAVGKESSLGTLEVGKLADIVILYDDPFTVPVEQLATVRVAHTIVDGKVVYTRPN